MNGTRRPLLRPIFLAAIERPPGEVAAFLDEACGEDDQLRREVESLLAMDSRQETPSILARPLILNDEGGWDPPGTARGTADGVGTHGADEERDGAEEKFPRAFGPYVLKGVLGEGSFGRVYLAEQAFPKREVAIKVLRGEALSRQALARFKAEADALARLDHPNIARIHEAGSIGARPYIAMERAVGVTLCVYRATGLLPGVAEQEPSHGSAMSQPFQESSLGRAMPLPSEFHSRSEGRGGGGGGGSRTDVVRRIVGLVAAIAEAVEHAHQRGVIHRDLKPRNIIVDSNGQPKVLDFGVARLLDPTGAATRSMAAPMVIGTLAYLSPEQARGERGDTRSDVYALGAILYELLCGKPVFAVADLPLAAALALVDSGTPAPLSRTNTGGSVDLAAVVAKALEHDPDRRYASAGAMAADLKHVLADEPTSARPITVGRLLVRTARKHSLVTAAAAAVVASTAIIGAFWVRTQHQAAAAAQVARTAATDLLNEVVGPMAALTGTNSKRAEILARIGPSLERFAAAYPRDEGVQGDYARYLELRADAALEFNTVDVEARRRVVAIRAWLAGAAPTDSERRAEQAIAIIKLGDAIKVTDSPAAALTLYQQALTLQEPLLAASPRDPHRLSDVAWSFQRIAEWMDRLGDVPQASEIRKRHLEVARTQVAVSPQDADSHRSLGAALIAIGWEHFAAQDFHGARAQFEQALLEIETARRLAPGHRETDIQRVSILQNLATARRWEEGENANGAGFELLIQAARDLVRESGGDAPARGQLASVLCAGAETYIDLGHAASAAALAGEAVDIAAELSNANPSDGTNARTLARSLWTLARCDAAAGRNPAPAVSKSLAMYRQLMRQAPGGVEDLRACADLLTRGPVLTLRDYPEAMKLSRLACDLTQWRAQPEVAIFVHASMAAGETAVAIEGIDHALARLGGEAPAHDETTDHVIRSLTKLRTQITEGTYIGPGSGDTMPGDAIPTAAIPHPPHHPLPADPK